MLRRIRYPPGLHCVTRGRTSGRVPPPVTPPATAESKFGDPTNDVAFKNLFSPAANSTLLQSFMNAVLKKTAKDRITEVATYNGELGGGFNTGKGSRLDLLCKDGRGHQFIIEMEKDIHKGTTELFCKRIQFYGSKVYSHQLSKGETYLDLKPVVCITITNSSATGSVISQHEILDIATNKRILHDMTWIFVELSNFRKDEGDLDTELDEWMYLFTRGHKMEEIPSSTKNAVVREAYGVLERANWSDDLRNAYIMEEIRDLDTTSYLAGAHKGGVEKGKRDTAVKLKEAGVPHETIAVATGLSVQAVEALNSSFGSY
jgi:predicted transposase/invertase (TIGR01784 family)